jgi:hypothetical protein
MIEKNTIFLSSHMWPTQGGNDYTTNGKNRKKMKFDE